ncbi:hydroxyacyl-thioester dehydratase type 2, mitochondrial-like [Lycorma delicatula]|uniref:hydroxyacyl-thioester dehydratase type 2, mitochondrial-like n=1 Tax=Lycorma delicatula TaxID=130591 RepID=UPI003F50E987
MSSSFSFIFILRLLLFYLPFTYVKNVDIYDGTNYKPIKVKLGDSVKVDKFVCEKDLEIFTNVSGDVNPIYINEPKFFHGSYLNMLVLSVMGTKFPGPGILFVEQNMRFPHACFVNQLVTIHVKVVDVGRVITCNFSIYSHKDEVFVIEGEAKFMIIFRDITDGEPYRFEE